MNIRVHFGCYVKKNPKFTIILVVNWLNKEYYIAKRNALLLIHNSLFRIFLLKHKVKIRSFDVIYTKNDFNFRMIITWEQLFEKEEIRYNYVFSKYVLHLSSIQITFSMKDNDIMNKLFRDSLPLKWHFTIFHVILINILYKQYFDTLLWS